MQRWLTPLLFAPLLTACVAELDAGPDGDTDTSLDGRTDTGGAATKVVRWPREAVLESGDGTRDVGWAVALDGDTAIVTSRNMGVAYAFQRVGDQWARPHTLRGTGIGEGFGTSVAIQGDTAVIGADGDDSAATNAGAIYVFTRTDGTWRRTAKLVAPDAARDDGFGIAVAIDGNHIVAGAFRANAGAEDAGAAYVFQRSGDGWALDQKLVVNDPLWNDQAGRSVAIDGRWVVLGAPARYGGQAYVFRRGPLGVRWRQNATLQADEDETGDEFGLAVAVAGSTILVGAHEAWDDFRSGAAYVFTHGDGGWDQRAKLVPGDDADGDSFGRSVALTDGMAVVGAPYSDQGGAARGAAYVFTGSGNRWTQQARLRGDGDDASMFGFSVAASGKLVVVGAKDDLTPERTGAAHAFIRE
jgi:hypothetical protein